MSAITSADASTNQELQTYQKEVLDAQNEISKIRNALRKLNTISSAPSEIKASESSSSSTNLGDEANQSEKNSKEDDEGEKKKGGEIENNERLDVNVLKLRATKVTGLPEAAKPIMNIQLSSPIESQTITKVDDIDAEPNVVENENDGSIAVFKGVQVNNATLSIDVKDLDIPLGSSSVLDVKPLTEVDVLNGVFKKVTNLEVAIVPNDGDENKLALEHSKLERQDTAETTEFQDAQSEITEQIKEEEQKKGQVEDNSGDGKDSFVELSSPDDSPKETEAITSKLESAAGEKPQNEEEKEMTTKLTSKSVLIPVCTIYVRVEYIPSIKDQKDILYDHLNKASKRKAAAADKLRKVAMSAARAKASGTMTTSGEKSIVQGGFLNKKTGSGERRDSDFLLVRLYERSFGPNSAFRKIFPIAKNYIIFFAGVAIMHFQGQHLSLPAPV